MCLTEIYSGVALTLDIGVLDTTTCKPLSNVSFPCCCCGMNFINHDSQAMVELWGRKISHRVFRRDSNEHFQPTLSGNMALHSSEARLRLVRSSASRKIPACSQYSTPSATNGIAEFQTIFPGYTTGSANHLNILVHPTASETAGVSHIGQLFFTDPWTGGYYFIRLLALMLKAIYRHHRSVH
jgi:hypothetical protein